MFKLHFAIPILGPVTKKMDKMCRHDVKKLFTIVRVLVINAFHQQFIRYEMYVEARPVGYKSPTDMCLRYNKML